ncbi:MAG: transposase [Phenylobacterium sp.]
MTKAFNDIDAASLSELIERVGEAKKHDLALTAEDYDIVLDALVTLMGMQERLAEHGTTIHKLRKLLGIEKSSEKGRYLGDDGEKAKTTKKKSKKSKPPKDNKDDDGSEEIDAVVVNHELDNLSTGDACPECLVGKVYKYHEQGRFLRITGLSPFLAEQHVMEKWRCNTCGAYFTAPLPEEVLADGTGTQKYGYSARSLMAIHKYYAGLPFYRQGSLQELLGVSISPSTIFDQVKYVSNDIKPVYQEIFAMAGNAVYLDIDDTTHRILDQTSVEKKCRNSDKMRLRTGVYSSGLIATTADERQFILFETNIGHAGEFIDSVLLHRESSSPAPVVMSDALSGYKPTVTESVTSLCNAHARRQFVDVISHFPDEVSHIIDLYGDIWANETEVVERELSPSK